jgi:ORF6N domain
MTKKRSSEIRLASKDIQRMVHVVRGQRVMLDFDLARLYGVTTAALNQAVGRNMERFPEDFSYLLTRQEVANLISQIVISRSDWGGRRKAPRAFTEHGVAMLSSVLRSPTAVRVNIEIMRAFVRIRRLMATPGELVEQLTQLAETVQLHDEQIKTIVQVINKLTERPEEPKRRIGFHAVNDETKL